jgi:hypothetical protein
MQETLQENIDKQKGLALSLAKAGITLDLVWKDNPYLAWTGSDWPLDFHPGHNYMVIYKNGKPVLRVENGLGSPYPFFSIPSDSECTCKPG